jgi:hypothetical protein
MKLTRRSFLAAAAALAAAPIASCIPAPVAAAVRKPLQSGNTLLRGEIGQWEGIKLYVHWPDDVVLAAAGEEFPVTQEIVDAARMDFEAGHLVNYFEAQGEPERLINAEFSRTIPPGSLVIFNAQVFGE